MHKRCRQSSSKIGKIAGKILRNRKYSQDAQSVSAAILSLRRRSNCGNKFLRMHKKCRHSSLRIGKIASKILRNSKYPKDAQSVSAAILSLRRHSEWGYKFLGS